MTSFQGFPFRITHSVIKLNFTPFLHVLYLTIVVIMFLFLNDLTVNIFIISVEMAGASYNRLIKLGRSSIAE